MKLITQQILSLCIFVVITTSSLFAKEDQFYFMARQAPSGSITNEGQQSNVVYLRWDSIEGTLPSDIVSFRLLRNNVPVSESDFPAHSVMSVADLNKLYIGSAQKRRKLEIVTKLNELAVSKGDSFSASNFATYLHGLISPLSKNTYNPLWAFLGSQTDFNIAQARYRGWIDILPSTEIVEYELLAVNSVGNTVRLGFTRVDRSVETVLLGATKLEQIRNSTTRCDYPEDAKDHYTVSLNWLSPGGELTVTDNFAAKLYISGFDLYRTRNNLAGDVKQAPARDIASLAAQVSSDSRGNPNFGDLERINTSLIIDSGDVAGEAKWREARDLLKRAGLKPGDRRAYYLVARDFTGNYGPTIEAIVEVPRTTRPPVPWNIRTFSDQTSSAANLPSSAFSSPDALLLGWDKVDLNNYTRMFQGTRKYCNMAEAQQTGILEFVGIDQDCNSDLHSSVRLDVEGYRIYRFIDFDVAGHFIDSDGDGYADSDERQLEMQCDASNHPAGAIKYLAPEADVQVINMAGGDLSLNKPARVRLRDKVPANKKGTVYWYRIASVVKLSDTEERLSFLSAPQRGFFPDRTPPEEPIVKVLKPRDTPTGCKLINDPNKSWNFKEKLRLAGESPYQFDLTCSGNKLTTFSELVSAKNGVLCRLISERSECSKGSQVSLEMKYSEDIGFSCEVNIPNDIAFCSSGDVEIVPTYEYVDDVLAGDLVSSVLIDVKPKSPDHCVALFETIDGSSTRVASSCDVGGINYISDSGLFCGYAVSMDENNNISTTVPIPCSLAPTNPKALGAPQILSFDVNDSKATFTFRLPSEQAAVTMIKLIHETAKGETNRTISSTPSINTKLGEIVTHTADVGTLQGSKDRFCLSLKAIARSSDNSSLNSSWGKQRCYERLSGGVEDVPTYLPWPLVKPATKGKALTGAPLDIILRTQALDIIGMPLINITDELAGKCTVLSKIGDTSTASEYSSSISEDIVCSDSGRSTIQAGLKPSLNFLLYRQRREEDLQESDWVQVSPLIEFAHFDKMAPELQIKDPLYKWRLNDPFIKFFKMKDKDFYAFMYHDRYPFVKGTLLGRKVADVQPYEFRYQAVYFDSKHRPARWRQSDWFKAVE